MLTGREIKRQVGLGRIRIEPFDPSRLKESSYVYRLGRTMRRLLPNGTWKGTPCLDPRLEMRYEEVEIPESGLLILVEEAWLGSTEEKFGSDFYASLVTGTEEIGDVFVKNHACAGLIDQGFFNHITLEITAKLPTIVFPGMAFGQIFWFNSVGECDLYRGKYNQGSNAARPSQIHRDWKS